MWIVKIALHRPHTFIALVLLILIMSPVGILRTPQDSSGQRPPTDRQPLFRLAANWFTWPSRFCAVGPSSSETLFDAGRRRATKETAVAAYDGSVANYRQTTLTAFQQVEDNLAVLRISSAKSGS
jgi:outer membrane protein TolC